MNIRNYNSFLDWCLLIMIEFVLLGALSSFARARGTDGTAYMYLNFEHHWCAVRSVENFKNLVNSDDASQLDADQAQVWFSGDRPVRISEFRMDADGEWSTTAIYSLNSVMNVTSSYLIIRSGDPPKDRLSRFTVRRGAYEPKPGPILSANVFRQAISLSSFPFAPLVKRARNIDPKAKLCV